MKKILVIRLGAIGDVILTTPAILNLKLSFPDAKIYFLTREHIAGLAEHFPGVDEILSFPRKATFVDLFRMGEFLDKMGFDMVLDLHGNIRSKYLMKHIAASVKVQYRKRRFERVKAVKWKKISDSALHTIDLYNRAVRDCGGKVFAGRPVLRLGNAGGKSAGFNNPLPTVAIAPGASYPTKQWFPERFRVLAVEISKQMPANVVLILDGRDEKMEALQDEIPADRLKVLFNEDLSNLARIISENDLLVCNDSALSHLGSAVGTPVIALFGPTHPTLGFAPRGMKDVIMQVDEFCRPCSLHGKKPCYRDRQYCFENITVNDVLDKATEMIENKAKGRKAIFVDRDGALIREKGFLDNPDEVEPEDGAIEAVKTAREAGYKVIVISNQSGVARGYFSEERVKLVNQRVLQVFARGAAKIDDILYCPHYPRGVISEYSVECSCRKPSPGMVELACRRHNINPFLSYTIGDKLSDINLAYLTGGKGILVRTGYGKESEKELHKGNLIQPEEIAENLFEAVKYIVANA